jgi:2-polyprenyl-3-methyl-5-hydroxy-6-metoxy-1,4-benzoquinol methylase
MPRFKSAIMKMKKIRSGKSLDLSDHFASVFNKNAWKSGESFSGIGSTLDQTVTLRKAMKDMISQLEIKSLLDVPCGDSNWMRAENYFEIEYTGVDIVPQLILLNNKLNEYPTRASFLLGDFTSFDSNKSFDMVFCRDLFVHLCFADILKCFESMIRTQSKYLAVTTFTRVEKNLDITYPSGLESIIGWRPLNMQLAPFELMNPVIILNEGCTEKEGSRTFDDKCIIVFSLEAIVKGRDKLRAFLE